MKARRIALPTVLLAALAAIAVPIGALEVTNGMVKLTLHEGIGRFSLAGLAQASSGSYTPLLVAQDPRSSMVSILVSDRVIRLGESSDFLEAVEKTATGARFIWTSKQLVVTETFSFIGAPGADVASGVRVDLQVKNVSEQNLAVAVRYLFDTWLGEASSVHFRTDSVAGLTRELTVTKDERPAYWVSPLADSAEGFGFQCMLSGEGVTVPDRVVFANWKRLSDAAWSYTTSAARTFSQAPYSMNDSAVGQYYDSRPIPRGESTTITLALGRASPSGLTLQTSATSVAVAAAPSAQPTAAEPAAVEPPVTEAAAEPVPVAEAPAATTAEPVVVETPATTPIVVAEAAPETAAVETPPAPNPVTEARTDLAAINELLREIDRRLADGSAITAEELAALERSLAALKERAAFYGAGRE
jgi:hypothetical protein